MNPTLTKNELSCVHDFKQIEIRGEYKDYVLTGINDEGKFFVTVRENGDINCNVLSKEDYHKMQYCMNLILQNEQPDMKVMPQISSIYSFLKSVNKMMQLQSEYFKTRSRSTLAECKKIEADVRAELKNLEKVINPLMTATLESLPGDYINIRVRADKLINEIQDSIQEFRAETGLVVSNTAITISEPDRNSSIQINL